MGQFWLRPSLRAAVCSSAEWPARRRPVGSRAAGGEAPVASGQWPVQRVASAANAASVAAKWPSGRPATVCRAGGERVAERRFVICNLTRTCSPLRRTQAPPSAARPPPRPTNGQTFLPLGASKAPRRTPAGLMNSAGAPPEVARRPPRGPKASGQEGESVRRLVFRRWLWLRVARGRPR